MIHYVITHLGEGVPRQSTYAQQIQRWRNKLQTYQMLLAWDPIRTLTSPIRYGKTLSPLSPQQMQRQRNAYQTMLRKTEQQAALKSLLEQAQQNVILSQMLRELIKESPHIITEKLNDEQPLVRWLAIQAVGRKRIPVEDKLIGLLSDPYPQVRDAARQALVRISRGNDFGPAPNATAKQIAQASQEWRQWLDRQDAPTALAPSRRVPDLYGPPIRLKE